MLDVTDNYLHTAAPMLQIFLFKNKNWTEFSWMFSRKKKKKKLNVINVSDSNLLVFILFTRTGEDFIQYTRILNLAFMLNSLQNVTSLSDACEVRDK